MVLYVSARCKAKMACYKWFAKNSLCAKSKCERRSQCRNEENDVKEIKGFRSEKKDDGKEDYQLYGSSGDGTYQLCTKSDRDIRSQKESFTPIF